MLHNARCKARQAKVEIPFYQGQMESFSSLGLSHDHDLVTCLYDSLNYVLDEQQVIDCFREAYDHLRPGGAFIFDVTTEYNLLHNFAGFTFAENLEDASYIWENAYNIEKKICVSKVTVFQHLNGRYLKSTEEHVQRVYPSAWLTQQLQERGFELLGTFHNLTDEPVHERCERIHFVCRKS